MKIKLFFFAAIALFVASCNSNEVVETENISPLRFTVSMAEPVEPRATLVEVGETQIKDLEYHWEIGDKIQLRFEQLGQYVVDIAEVSSVSNGGRTAEFTISFPSALQPGNFTVYAYRSEVGSLDATLPKVTLPTHPQNYPTDLANQVKRVSAWAKVEATYAGGGLYPPIPLSFNHLGSMFTLKVKNVGTAAEGDVTDVVQFGLRTTEGANWLRNVGDGGAVFDLQTGNYEQAVDGTTIIMYSPSTATTIPVGEINTYYAWFVPGQYNPGSTVGISPMSGPANGDITGVAVTPKSVIDFQKGKNYTFFVHIKRVPYTTGTPPATYPYTVEFKTSATF